MLYLVVDGLINSFFPILSAFDDRIDELEDQIFVEASDEQLQEIFRMKRLLVGMRKAVTPQRDAFASLTGRMVELPGFDPDDEHYFRDVYDHLIRISDLIDSYRDLLTSAMDVYLSTVSNRLNGVMKRLTIVATWGSERSCSPCSSCSACSSAAAGSDRAAPTALRSALAIRARLPWARPPRTTRERRFPPARTQSPL
jgi:hypothetical protein